MKFRKKPVVIEAVQFSFDGILSQEAGDLIGQKDIGDKYNWLEIKTLEGTMRVNPSDWIIKGVEGEIYPCKDSIFKSTYEPVT